jgi:type I restriction-modification system DNA methylase subunit
VCGFDTDITALDMAKARIENMNVEGVSTNWQGTDFLDHVLECHLDGFGPLFAPEKQEGQFDLVIANPPYVRTQVLGQSKARQLAAQFQIEGRVDLYQAFLLAMSRILRPGGVAGVIVSNRFLSTQGGTSVRRGLLERYNLKHVWDLGDTKLFEAAVLPAVLVMQKPSERKQTHEPTKFTAI